MLGEETIDEREQESSGQVVVGLPLIPNEIPLSDDWKFGVQHKRQIQIAVPSIGIRCGSSLDRPRLIGLYGE
jgi:hypothetical protein